DAPRGAHRAQAGHAEAAQARADTVRARQAHEGARPPMSFKLAVQRYSKWAAIILVIWIVATIIAVWILGQERLASPFSNKYDVQAQFDNVTGVAAGLGLPVNVAGVSVGQISKVRLQDGKAIATLKIDPGKLKHVYNDARAVLVPNTLLK